MADRGLVIAVAIVVVSLVVVVLCIHGDNILSWIIAKVTGE